MKEMLPGNMMLDELVDEYFSDSFGDGRKHYPNFLKIAYGLYNDIFYKKLRKYKTKYLQVDRSTNTAILPVDFSIPIGAGIKDFHGNYIPFYNSNDKVHPEECVVSRCGCKKCNCNSDICSAFTNIELAYEDITIDNQVYRKTIKTQKNSKGQVTQEIKEPYKAMVTPGDPGAGFIVKYREYSELLCNLVVKECGCISDSPENVASCVNLPGLFFPSNTCIQYYPRNYDCSKKKYYSINLEEHLIYLYDVIDVSKLILMYLPAGLDINEQIIVPQWMAEPLKSGIYARSIKFRNVPEGTKEGARRQFSRDIEDMFSLLWPIIPHEMIALQQIFMKW